MGDLRKQTSAPWRSSATAEPETGGEKSAGARREGEPSALDDTRPLSGARRAQRDRGAETRQRLIEAALDISGRFGFEGATTRQIADQAGANLAAINYHFGSKEALHVAVAEHIATRIIGLVGPVLMAVDSTETFATREAARAGLIRLIETFAETLLGEKEAEQWARFIVREQMQPTQAFEVIYRFMGTAHDLATRLVAAALGAREADEEARLRAFALMGQVLVFRVAQAVVLRRMEWQAVGEAERARIKRVIVAHIDAILDAEAGAT